MGGFCLVAELAEPGSVPNGATPSIFFHSNQLRCEVLVEYGEQKFYRKHIRLIYGQNTPANQCKLADTIGVIQAIKFK